MSDPAEITDISTRRYHNCPVCRDLCCGSEPANLCCLCYRVRRRPNGPLRSCRFCRDKVTRSISSPTSEGASQAQQPVHISMPQANAAEAMQVLEDFLEENRVRATRVKGIVEGVAELLGDLGRESDPGVVNRLNDRAQSLSDSVEALSSSFTSLVHDYLRINDSNASRFIWNLRRRVAMSRVPSFDETPAEPMTAGDPMSVFREVCRQIGRARREVDSLDARLNALMGTVNYILGPSPSSASAPVPAPLIFQDSTLPTPSAPPVPSILPTHIPSAPAASPNSPVPSMQINVQHISNRPPKECGHNYCQLSMPRCCSCSDSRPMADRYHVYIDGTGWVEQGRRDAHYCSGCTPPVPQPAEVPEGGVLIVDDYGTDVGEYSDSDEGEEVDIGFNDGDSGPPITNDNPHAVIMITGDGHVLASAEENEENAAGQLLRIRMINRQSPANNPTPKECGHDYCQLSIPFCCVCTDTRPEARVYHTYIDGRGWRPDGFRSAGYCSGCRDRSRNETSTTAVTFHASEAVETPSPPSLGTALTERQRQRREFLRNRLARAFGTLQEIRDNPSYISPIEAMFRGEEEEVADPMDDNEVTFQQLANDPVDTPASVFAIDNSCRLCFAAHIDSLFLPCAHMVCCRRCAMRLTHTLWDDAPVMIQAIHVTPCPICRTQIEGIMKVYRA
ncbi:hypothetical protein CALCODRAFT_503500 [Calocera cornea HHB12733]|uniref:RING-type domain-containing protein n=1 Tax=Calocera cornea HHB12733 TaxID=1353952 RepID=A0A165CUW2_9BASI|nr:hypothetical protein CALCODRAFT_503500 [Calocera cornea HHB12733]